MIDQNSHQDEPKTAVSPYHRASGYAPPAYLPTPEQMERAAALRRFNRLYVYIPFGIFSSLVLLTVITLFAGVFIVGSQNALSFISALADISVVLTTIPLILLGVLLLAGVAAFYYNGRSTPKQKYGRIQIFLWRLNNLSDKLNNKTTAVAPKSTKPINASHGLSSYISTLIKTIINR